MVTLNVLNCMNGITVNTITKMDEDQNCFAGQEKKSFCELGKGMLVLCGENLKMIQVKKGSTARCSETSQPTLVRSSYNKRMRLLVASGLVKGTIPTSMRKKSNQTTLDIVLKWPDGECVAEQK